jgi:CcmD family protein
VNAWFGRAGRLLLTGLLVVAATAYARAASEPPPTPAASTASSQAPTGAAQDQFVPVKPGDLNQEQLPATPLVFTAYAFVWVVLVIYVLTLWRRLGRVERELVEVRAQLQAKRS